jgi:hypothetical protein
MVFPLRSRSSAKGLLVAVLGITFYACLSSFLTPTSSSSVSRTDYQKLYLNLLEHKNDDSRSLRARLAQETARADSLALALRLLREEQRPTVATVTAIPNKQQGLAAGEALPALPALPIASKGTAVMKPSAKFVTAPPLPHAEILNTAYSTITWPNLSKTGGIVTQGVLDQLSTYQRTGITGEEGEDYRQRLNYEASHQEHPCGLLPSELAAHKPHEGETTCELASRLGPHLGLKVRDEIRVYTASQNYCDLTSLQHMFIQKSKVRVCLLPKSGSGGVRAFALIEQGIKLHPNIINVPMSDIRSADFVVWLPGSTKIPPRTDDCPPVSSY